MSEILWSLQRSVLSWNDSWLRLRGASTFACIFLRGSQRWSSFCLLVLLSLAICFSNEVQMLSNLCSSIFAKTGDLTKIAHHCPLQNDFSHFMLYVFLERWPAAKDDKFAFEPNDCKGERIAAATMNKVPQVFNFPCFSRCLNWTCPLDWCGLVMSSLGQWPYSSHLFTQHRFMNKKDQRWSTFSHVFLASCSVRNVLRALLHSPVPSCGNDSSLIREVVLFWWDCHYKIGKSLESQNPVLQTFKGRLGLIARACAHKALFHCGYSSAAFLRRSRRKQNISNIST